MYKRALAACAALALSVFASPAEAILYGGNPKLVVLIDHAGHDLISGEATLDRVVLGGCPGAGPAIDVDAAFDPVVGIEVGIPAGDWCSVTLEWDGVTTLEATGFAGESDAASTTSDLDPQTPPVSLSPFQVTEGILYGGNPKVVVWVE